MSTQDIAGYVSYRSGVQRGTGDLALPTGNFLHQQPPQPYTLQQTSNQPPTRAIQFQQFISWNQGQPASYNNSFHPQTAMYAAASPSYAITTDLRRIQGMETTIGYLRELLSKEYHKNIKERNTVDKTKKELEVALEDKKRFQEHLQEALAKINESKAVKEEANSALEEVLAVQKELSANQKQLQDTKSELITAQERIRNLETENTNLESKLAALSKEKSTCPRLSSSERTAGEEAHPCDEKNVFANLKAEYDALKSQFDAIIEKKNTVSNQYKEMGKKYLYMVEYSGEQMYNEYEEKHTVFIEKLKSLGQNSANETQCFMIKQTLDCLQGQLRLLENYREDFRITIELLMSRIDQEIAQVSDLSIRAPKPQLEIQLDTFDAMFRLVECNGSVERDNEEDSRRTT
ncbi:myosin-2 heavy chain-like [Daphnia carinata]|uniref:myosin-2 heavy chain-like n=1 Tax=Daphnia carinata TaxID=120202 RepID=UPI00257BBFD5|nr:myosin-2 heavy chain-like [Daphnia carinata]